MQKSVCPLLRAVYVLLLSVLVLIPAPSAFAADETTAETTSVDDADCPAAEEQGCGDATEDPGQIPSGDQPSVQGGNPINLLSGNKYQREMDFRIPGGKLTLQRAYNSRNSDNNIGVGQGWHHTFAVSLYDAGNGRLEVVQSSGSRLYFSADGSDEDGNPLLRGAYPNEGYLVKRDRYHEWHLPDGRTLRFRGRYLVRIDWPGHQHLELFYKSGLVSSVTDETGRVMRLEYHAGTSQLPGYDSTRFGVAAGHLSRLILPDGSQIEYDYDQNRNLTRARYADGTSREYHYEDSIYPNHLTGITDRTNVRLSTWTYDDKGRAISSEHANGIERVTIDYPDLLAVDTGEIVETQVTNALGQQSTYTWQELPGKSRPQLLSSTGIPCSTCPPTGFAYSYDESGRVLSKTRTGQGTAVGIGDVRYVYDVEGRKSETWRSDALAQEHLIERLEYEGNSLQPVRRYTPSINPDAEFVNEIERDEQDLPITIANRGFAPQLDAGGTTIGFTPIERVTRFAYDEGRLVSMDGPRDDVEDITRFNYDQLGRLVRMALPSGEVIVINKYDAFGRAVEFRRAAHPTVTLEHDNNGNVSRVTRLGKSVVYVYNAENKLVRVINPNGKTSTLSYDEAQRLTSVSDDLGRTVQLTLNAESQIETRTFLGVNGGLINSLNYMFDAEGRIQAITEEQLEHSSGNAISTTIGLEYDEHGQFSNAQETQSGASTQFVFSELGRLLETVNPNGLSQRTEYDVHNRVIAQTDQRLNTTHYHRDDFGQVRYLVSPDTGITQYDFDAAGNRTEQRDADKQLTGYQWDAANRLVEQQDIDGTTTYTYHPTNGRLIKSSNPHTTETYTYTTLAQLKTHTREIDGHAFTTKYVYAADGKLVNKILPDGQSLRYHYYESGPNNDTLRAITRETLFGLGQSTLLGEVDLDWRDGQTSFLSHNGQRNEVQYHDDGKVSSVSVDDTLALNYEYDQHGKIVGIREDGLEQQYEYSAGQLSQADTTTGNYHYQYDVTGNRTSASAFGSDDDHESTLDYVAVARGNRLESARDELTGDVIKYRYNDSGSPIAVGELVYEYNARQRPIKVSRGGELVAEYRYNNFGERIKKVTYSQNQKKVTYYLYDNQQLVAEIDGDTLEYRQTVYLKQAPVIHLIGKTAYGVHTDHLGTPKLLTNDEGKTVWKAAHTPLGLAVIETEAIEFNLRFPGHYADSETGTHYNYQRDYDPRTGRYLTSDPVGLEGGDNTYAYVDNNVLGAFDALGLAGQLLGGEINSSSSAQPFTLRNSGNAVVNPSTLPPDLAELGITDPNQLIDSYFVSGSTRPCEQGIEAFNLATDDYIDALQGHQLLVGGRIEDAIEELKKIYPSSGDALRWALEISNEFDDEGSYLLIGSCATDEAVAAVVTKELGKLVHPDEMAAIIASLLPPDDGTSGTVDGVNCRPAQIIDVTDLHAAVLERFQLKLATDPRVVDAEKALILAQEALADYLRLNPNTAPCDRYRGGGSTTICQLTIAVEYAAERLANVLSDVYDEQVSNNLLPRYDDNATKSAARQEIMLAVVGIFIPLTATDAAIEATLIATTAGWGKVARMFEGLGDLISVLRGAGRAGIDEIIAKGSDVARRANAIKMQQAYPGFPGLSGLNYADVVRMESKLGTDGLRKLETDFVNTPGLADAFKNNPGLADGWRIINDIGACSFAGSTAVVTEHGLKPISQLQLGLDKVLARDERTGAQEFKNILAKYSNRYAEKVVIRSVNDDTNEQVSVVSNKIHPIFVKSSGGMLRVTTEGHAYLGDREHGDWVDAADLRVGDQLQNDDGTWSTVTSVEIKSEEFTAYNLTVEDFNTYFVSEQGRQSAFWVHNTCPGANAEVLAAVAAKPELGDTYRFLYGGDNAARQFPEIRNNPAALEKVHELRGDADFVSKVGGEDELRKILESQMRPLVENATSTVDFNKHMDNVQHFVNNHLDPSIPGSENALRDMKNDSWTNQEGLHHMLEGLSRQPAGTVNSVDLRFTNTCDTNCRFDVKLTDGTLIEYKNVKLGGVNNVTGNQLSTYFGNIDSIDKLNYTFNKKKILSDPDFPAGGDVVDELKTRMQTRLNSPAVKNAIFDNIKDKLSLLDSLGLDPDSVTPADLQRLINDTGSELYNFIKVI